MSRIPSPLITGSQWTRGEPIDDLKLHTRIDGPLERLGAVARTFNTDLAGFYGYVPSGYSGAANADVQWTAGYDTGGNYDGGGFFHVAVSGLYLLAANLGTAAAAAGACSFARNGNTDPRAPWSRDGPAVANGGPRLGAPIDLAAGDYLSVRSVQAFTTSTAGINWFFVQQLTWA